MLALTFLVLFLGNFLTTLKVVHQKIQKNQEKVQKNDWDKTLRETPPTSYKGPVVLHTHNRLIDWPQSDQAGRSRSHRFSQALMAAAAAAASSQSIRPTGFLLSNDSSSMLLHSRLRRSKWCSPDRPNSMSLYPVHKERSAWKECVLFGCMNLSESLCSNHMQLKEGR